MDAAWSSSFRASASAPEPSLRDVDAPGAALALLVSLFWGANTVAIKIGLVDAPPLRLAALRFVVGGLVIALWAFATGRLAGFRIAAARVAAARS